MTEHGNTVGEPTARRAVEEVNQPAELIRSMISKRVIPDLVERVRRDSPVPDDAMRDTLLRLALRGDSPRAVALLNEAMIAGMQVPMIVERLLTPVARALGREWEEDSCDFVAVTFGMNVLSDLLGEMREIAPPRVKPAGMTKMNRAVLLATAPGEQHFFGLRLVADAFERAGWVAELLINPSTHVLQAQAAASRYDVIGLSVAADRNVTTLPALIDGLRSVSFNKTVRILAGGPALLRHPETGTRIGADAVAIDAENAVAEASLLANLQQPAIGRGRS